MGIDLGAKTLGLAVGDTDLGVASPLGVINRKCTSDDLSALVRCCREAQAEKLIFGLPLELSGEEGAAAAKVRGFSERAAAVTGLEVAYWDERFSTAQVERVLIAGRTRRARRRRVVDKLAATVILQGYLDAAHSMQALPVGHARPVSEVPLAPERRPRRDVERE